MAKTKKLKQKKTKTIKNKKTNKLVYWTGPGSRNDGLHSPKEFLRIAQGEYLDWNIKCPPNKNIENKKNNKLKRFQICGKVLKRNDIEGWMKIANAKWATP